MRILTVTLASALVAALALVLWPLPEPDRGGGLQLEAPVREPVEPGRWSAALFERMASVGEADTSGETTGPDPLAGVSLIGTVEGNEGGWALLERDGVRQTLAVGASLDGFVLVELTPERAVFERDGARVIVPRRL